SNTASSASTAWAINCRAPLRNRFVSTSVAESSSCERAFEVVFVFMAYPDFSLLLIISLVGNNQQDTPFFCLPHTPELTIARLSIAYGKKPCLLVIATDCVVVK